MPFTFSQLRRGLERAEFVPYFQPVVDLRSGKLHGFEILARWERPRHGLIGPNVFIPCMERHRLINNLTATLLIQAFAAVRRLPGDFRLAVNFSPSQLHDPKLPALLELIAEISEFDLRRLTIELTETALLTDLDRARSVATEFKQLGVRLALDDFGTGYSSMLHLQSLPLDQLKVDRSFVQSMLETRESRKITAGVISLGVSLDLLTIAEGIEDPSQADLLVWQGCHLGQGFLFGRPVPAAELAAACTRRFAAAPGHALQSSVADPLLAFDAHPAERLSQLRAIYDGAPVALAFIDKQLRYVNLNQRLADLNGTSIHAHLGRKVSEILPTEIYTRVEQYLIRALEGESFPSVQVRTHAPEDGESATFGMVSFQPVRDEAGEIVGVSVAISDITSLKQAEEALRESEDHYRHTVELNPQLPWVADATGSITMVSSRWGEFTGLTLEETSNHGWLKLVHLDDLEHVTKAIEASVTTGVPLDIEYRIRAADRWVWMRSRGAPRRDAEGNIIRWYGSVECTDERKRAEEELRIGEARLRAIFDAAPVGLVLVDSASRRVLNANRRAEELIGFRIEPGLDWVSLGWEAFDASGRPLDETERPLMRAILYQESTRGVEARLRRPDGSRRWLSFSAEPVFLDDGKQFGAVLVIQDIESERRRNEWLPVKEWLPRLVRT